MIHIKLILLSASFTFVLSSCIFPSHNEYKHVNKCSKGMAQSTVADIMPTRAKNSSSFDDSSITYSMEHYQVLCSVSSSGGGKYSTSVAFFDDIFFLYSGKTLRYWGDVESFSKSEDDTVRRLARTMFGE